MSRPPRAWGLFFAGLWFAAYAFTAAVPFQWSAILLAVIALIAAILLLFGAD